MYRFVKYARLLLVFYFYSLTHPQSVTVVRCFYFAFDSSGSDYNLSVHRAKNEKHSKIDDPVANNGRRTSPHFG